MSYNYHEGIPREPADNALWRRKLLETLREKPEFRAVFRLLCARDNLYFLNSVGRMSRTELVDYCAGEIANLEAVSDAMLRGELRVPQSNTLAGSEPKTMC
jgi:hypothetical protein